jgi:hypothetical protein
VEGLFSTSKYNTPKVITGKEETAVLLIRLLIMDPGTNTLYPEMGVGILSRFVNCSKDDIPDLELEIKKQIDIYLPLYQETSVKVSIENRILLLSITIDDTLYKFTTNDMPNKDETSLINLS